MSVVYASSLSGFKGSKEIHHLKKTFYKYTFFPPALTNSTTDE